MYSLVRPLDDENRDTSGGFRLPSVVEDERGMRLLVCGQQLSSAQWEAALSHGIAGLVRMTPPVAFVPVDMFAAQATRNPFNNNLRLQDKFWHETTPGNLHEMREDYAKRNVGSNPFVHLHTHSEFSQLDGLSTLDEISEAIVADGQQAVAITDHGTCAGHPALQKMANLVGIKPIFGIEAYLVDDIAARGDQFDYWHLVLWAEDDEGLRNLWALSTASYHDGFYGKPRVDWEMLKQYRTGLLASTACLGGPVLKPLIKGGDEQRAVQNLLRLGSIFHDDLYVELHTYDDPQQVEGNRWLVDMTYRYNLPTVAVVDSHYALPSQKDLHQIWLKITTGGELFEGDHLLAADEVRQKLAYLPDDIVEQSIKNTGLVADRCSAEIRPRTVMPIYTRKSAEYPTDEDRRRRDTEKMLDIIMDNWPERITARTDDETPYFERTGYEGPLLIDKQFPGYFLMVWDQVMYAKRNGILVGPGRGSAAGSLVAYEMRITEVDPIAADLSVDRFLTPGRKSLPDFDIDYPSSKSDQMLAYVGQRWGEDHIAQVGTHQRLRNKQAFKDVHRTLADRLGQDSFAAAAAISKVIDQAEASTAGLGLSWDDLLVQAGDQLAEYQEAFPLWFEVAGALRGRLRTYGRHAAGVIIDPDEPLTGILPMRNGEAGKPMITQFDFEALEWLGFIKFDFLKLRNLDTIQATLDEIRAKHPDADIDVYSWQQEYEDPEVFDELAQGWTMGVFQIETNLGTRTVKQIKPMSVAELADCTTMARPGPMRSGLDKLYLARRSGQEPVHFADPRLADVLDRTFGCMLYQEDIMALTRVLAGYDADEADHVRKILGKKKRELVEAEGRKFIERAVANDTDRAVAEALWAQMAEFALYSFNRAHAFSYATLAYWTAWFKTHYPHEYLTGTMTTLAELGSDTEDIPRFVAEAARLGYEVLPPDINESKVHFTGNGLQIRFGLLGISGIGLAAARDAALGQPYTSYEDFLARKGGKCNIGHVKKLVAAGCLDSLYPHRKALQIRLDEEAAGIADRCAHKTEGYPGPNGLPCVFDWDSLPVIVGKTGKPLANQSKRLPPKKCTRACRQYTPRPAPDYTHLTPYTDAEIRDLEVQTLGVYLSSSPFDGVPDDPGLYTADDLMVADSGEYLVLGIVLAREADSRGRDFGYVKLQTRSGQFRPAVFSKLWKSDRREDLSKDAMLLCQIAKTDRGYRLVDFNRLK